MTSVAALVGQDVGGGRLVTFDNKDIIIERSACGADRVPPVHSTVLSLPGGGIQGVVALEALARIEEKTGRPICELFDMIAGTSTGGIIALALAKNKHTGKPTLSARELQNMYVEFGEEIFSASFLRKMFAGGGLLAPKFSVSGLKKQLTRHFRELKLSDLETPIAITAVNRVTNELHVFRSGDKVGKHDFSIVDAALATSAVPGGFPSHRARSMAGVEFDFMDGGIQKNNPIILAYSEAHQLFGFNSLTIASVATGSCHEMFESGFRRKFNGLLMQPFTLIKRMLQGQGTADEKLIENLPHVSVIKINPRLDVPMAGLDLPDTSLEAAKPSNLRNLKVRALISLCRDELSVNSPFSRLLRVLRGPGANDPSVSTQICPMPDRPGSGMRWALS